MLHLPRVTLALNQTSIPLHDLGIAPDSVEKRVSGGEAHRTIHQRDTSGRFSGGDRLR